MLRVLRRYSRSAGIKILYGVLAALFLVWGVGAVGDERMDVIAEVHGESISRRELDRTAALLQRRYQDLMRGALPVGLDLRGRALDQLIDEALLRHEAERLGVRVSDAEVVESITAMPELQDGGRFDRERLEAFLLAQRDRGEFEQEVRRGLLFDRLRAIVTDGAQVTDGEVAERYRFDHERVNLSFVRIAAADLAAEVTLADADLERHLAEQADRYRVPPRVRVRYAAYRPADFEAGVAPTDGEIAEHYELNKEEQFTDPEQVRARHILVQVAPTATDEQRAAARTKAEDLLAKVKAGGDFAALARQHSDDPGSKANGGDLGLFPRGRMTPAFETAAFALEPGGVSDVVETPFGFHVIALEERKAAGTRPLDAVRDEIVATLRRERAFDAARRRAEADRRNVVRGQPLAQAVGDRPLEETAPFAAGAAVPGLGVVPAFAEAAFALGPNQVSDLIETEDAIYLLSPIEHLEAHVPPLAEIRERVERDARRARAEALARERAEALLARAKTVGLEAAAAEAHATVEETGTFERRVGAVPKLGNAGDLRTDAFTLTPERPLAPTVYQSGGDAIVAALRERPEPDMSGFEAAKDRLHDSLLQRKRESILEAYLSFLKQRATQEGALRVKADALTTG